MATRIRNNCCVPFLNAEGEFVKSIIPPEYIKKGLKCDDLPSTDRLHAHQTLASARRFSGFKNHRNLVPSDQLDFALTAGYDQTYELWRDIAEVYRQPESIGIETWRRLRNTRDLTPDREQQAVLEYEEQLVSKKKKIPYKYNRAHKVMISGVQERTHPSYIKLMNSSHHSPQTNAGYSRQDSDGNPYQY